MIMELPNDNGINVHEENYMCYDKGIHLQFN